MADEVKQENLNDFGFSKEDIDKGRGYYEKFSDLYLEMIKDESFTKECFLYNSLLMIKTIQSFISENGIETERQNELLKKMDIVFKK